MKKRIFEETTLEELWAESQLLPDAAEITKENIISELREKFGYEDDDLGYLQMLYQGEGERGVFGSDNYRNKIFQMYAAMSSEEMKTLCETT